MCVSAQETNSDRHQRIAHKSPKTANNIGQIIVLSLQYNPYSPELKGSFFVLNQSFHEDLKATFIQALKKKIFKKGFLFCWFAGSDWSWKFKCAEFISIQQSTVMMLYSDPNLLTVEEQLPSFLCQIKFAFVPTYTSQGRARKLPSSTT